MIEWVLKANLCFRSMHAELATQMKHQATQGRVVVGISRLSVLLSITIIFAPLAVPSPLLSERVSDVIAHCQTAHHGNDFEFPSSWIGRDLSWKKV